MGSMFKFAKKLILFPVQAGGAILASSASILAFLGIGGSVETTTKILLTICLFLLILLVSVGIERTYSENELPVNLSLIDVRISESKGIHYGDLLITSDRCKNTVSGDLLKLNYRNGNSKEAVCYLLVDHISDNGCIVSKIWYPLTDASYDLQSRIISCPEKYSISLQVQAIDLEPLWRKTT